MNDVAHARQKAEQNAVLLSFSGSRLYRTNHAESDYDFQGVYVPSLESYCGFEQPKPFSDFACSFENRNKVRFPQLNNTDSMLRPIKDFMKLVLQQNQKALELLWTSQADTLYASPSGLLLKSMRSRLLSKRIYSPFLGFAESQAQLVERHRSYISLPDLRKNVRNEKRSQLEGIFGFDTKSALHAIRALKMGIDGLKKSRLEPNRERAGDAGLLKSILNGDLLYEEFIQLYAKLRAELEEARDSSSLPENIDPLLVDQLLIEVSRAHLC